MEQGMKNSQDWGSVLLNQETVEVLVPGYWIEGEPLWAPVRLDPDFLVASLANMPEQDVLLWDPAVFGQVCKELSIFQTVSSTNLRFFSSAECRKLIMSLKYKFSLSLSLLNHGSSFSCQLNANFKESDVIAKHTLYCHPKQPLRMSVEKIRALLFIIIARKQILCLSVCVSPRVGYTFVPRGNIVLFPIFVTVWFIQMWYPNCLCKSCGLFSKSSWMLPILWISRQVKWQDWNDLSAWLASKLCFKF